MDSYLEEELSEPVSEGSSFRACLLLPVESLNGPQPAGAKRRQAPGHQRAWRTGRPSDVPGPRAPLSGSDVPDPDSAVPAGPPNVGTRLPLSTSHSRAVPSKPACPPAAGAKRNGEWVPAAALPQALPGGSLSRARSAPLIASLQDSRYAASPALQCNACIAVQCVHCSETMKRCNDSNPSMVPDGGSWSGVEPDAIDAIHLQVLVRAPQRSQRRVRLHLLMPEPFPPSRRHEIESATKQS